MTTGDTMPRAKPRPPSPGDLVRIRSLAFAPGRAVGPINLGLVLHKVRHARRVGQCHFQVFSPTGTLIYFGEELEVLSAL